MPSQDGGIFVRAFNISIQRDGDGKHVVRFPKLKEELFVPESHADRLEWIRQSCARFLTRVREKEELIRVPGEADLRLQ